MAVRGALGLRGGQATAHLLSLGERDQVSQFLCLAPVGGIEQEVMLNRDQPGVDASYDLCDVAGTGVADEQSSYLRSPARRALRASVRHVT